MASNRDYSAEHERSLELAQERGFADRAEQTEWRNFAREMGADTNAEVERYSQVFHEFEPGGYNDAGEWESGSMTVEDFQEIWMDLNDIGGEYDESYDSDFYEWMREFYSNT